MYIKKSNDKSELLKKDVTLLYLCGLSHFLRTFVCKIKGDNKRVISNPKR